MKKKHPFEPVIDANSKILILGSLPSVRSVQEGFYYMHPQNRFWKMLSVILNCDLVNASIWMKKEILLHHGIALYDIVAECEIEASKDSTIQKVEVQDIASLIQASKIERIILNGKTAYSLFIQAYPEWTKMAICAPSTSSANASYSLEKLIEAWNKYLL